MSDRRRALSHPLAMAALGGLALAACSDRTPAPSAPLLPTGAPSLGIVSEANGGGACMVDDVNMFTPGGPTNCTANDIRIATAYPTAGGTLECTPGSTVTVNMTAELQATSNAERQDIGVWIASDGGDARTGACNHYNLIPGKPNTVNGDGDQCAGMSAAGVPNPHAVLPLGTLTLQCNNIVTINNQTFLHVGSCLSWTVPGQDGVCSDDRDGNGTANQPTDFRAATVPGTPAKCNCEGFNVPVTLVGKIRIVKNAVPDHGQDFQFTHNVAANSTPAVTSPFSLDDDADPALSNAQLFDRVRAGSYTFTEAPVSGWTLSTPSCVLTGTNTPASTTAATNGITVNLASGQDVTCTFTNTAGASLDVEKQSVGGTGTFSYTGSGAGLPASFSRNTATANPTATAPFAFTGADAVGEKYVTETVPAGYLLSAITCTANGAAIAIGTLSGGTFSQGGSAGFEAGENTVRATLAPGDSPSCTFVNTASASIDIEKQTVGGTATFGYTASGSGVPASFSRNTATANPTASAAFPLTGADVSGDKIITETALPGWTLTNVACTNTGATVAIGTYAGGTFSAGVSAGYEQGDNSVRITPAAGSTTSCTFTNTADASLDVEKQSVGGTGTFSYTGSGAGLPASFSRNTATANPTATAPFAFTGLELGIKDVTETVPTGWRLTNIACVANGATIAIGTLSGGTFSQGASAGFEAGENTVRVTVAAGSTPACTFTNLLLATLTLNKHEGGALPLSRAWEFQLRTGASTSSAGTVVATASANTATGVVTFPGFLTPGAYQLCEVNMPAGYSNNLSGFTPAGATAEGGDNSAECVNVTLVSGANGPAGILGVPDPINNVRPPGGDARTIGYWKNWSSCTGGNQYAKAVGRGDADRTLDHYLPALSGLYPIGDITGPLSCEQAVGLLGKSDMNSGRKLASDPAYNLAAQFLAAKLNYLAGAQQCAAATTAITSAQALLEAIDFTGTGTYRNSMTPTQISSANSLASTLDQYNNNQLCPAP